MSAQMERGMGIAARKRERQQHDQAAQEQVSLHRNQHITPNGLKGSTFPHSTKRLQREAGPLPLLVRFHFPGLKKMYFTKAAAASSKTMITSSPIRPMPHIISPPIM